MQKLLTILLSASFALLITSCGGGAKDSKGDLGDKKAELEKLKKEQKTVNEKIAKLEEEISKVDSTAGVKAKLVALATIGADTFTHFIDLQGKVDAQNVAYAAPRNGQGGLVRQVFVKQGDVVRKGQVLLKLDDAVQRQQVAQAEQQISGVAAKYEQAKSVYQRRQNLWKENIGTELEVLNAKTDMDNAQSALNAAKVGVDLAKEQLNFTNVTAEIAGTVNIVNVRAGEMFAVNPQNPQIQIVNTSDLKVLVQVPENYLDRVNVGTNLRVTLPELNNKVVNTRVSVASKLIDPVSRSFYIEGKLQDKDLRPNQIAVVQIQDYKTSNAITIPVNTLQNDDKGKFVLVAVTENGKLIARKKQIVIGEIYGDKLEVKSGLQQGDKVIVDGFQGLYDGQVITTS
jgi:membrane fusion protein, multidrug efflux system